ncbi:MAG: DUF932 domain-containing protein [Bacteroidetes bacterium]|nr:DUF932 domain-containing protein [Bacteroidota bacterium]
MNKIESVSLGNGKALRQDDVFPTSEVKDLSNLLNCRVRKGIEKGIFSNGALVNVVSKGYSHLRNEDFFLEVEAKLIEAELNYVTRSINREDRSFSVSYLLSDDSYVVKVKNSTDEIVPMLNFINSYDGSCRTSGSFGFFRKVCANGLHVAKSKFGFAVKHRGDVAKVVIPEIKTMVNKFMDNEFYSLSKKFVVLAERPLVDVEGFVKLTADQLNLFQYESSEKNPLPSLNARQVIDTIYKESSLLGSVPTLWNGYNAVNELLHNKLKKTFAQQAKIDLQLFNFVSELSTN